MFNRTRSLIFLLLLTAPFTTSALERTHLLPPQAQTYVRLSNTTNFLAQLQKSSIGKLWKDPQFQDFVGHPDSTVWQEVFFSSESQAEDEVFREQLKMLTGEVVYGIDLDQRVPYIVADMSKEDFIRSLDLDDKLKSISEEPFDIIKSTFQDVEIIQYLEHPGTPRESSSWQAHVDHTLVLGHAKEWVEKCIVQLQKESIKEPEGHPVLNVNIPLATLIREGVLEDMKKNSLTGRPARYDPETLLDALGLMDVEDISIRLELKDSEMIADSTLRISDLEKGFFTLLDVQPAELPEVSFIPENISSIEVGRFNLLRFWQEIPNVLATAMPGVKPQFDMILAMIQQQTGINIEQDLLAHLGTKYVSFAETTDTRQSSVMAVELQDSMAFQQGLESALGAPALQPQVAAGLDIQDFLDHPLYTVKSPDPARAMAFAVAGDYLLYSQPDELRKVIRAQSSGAGDTAFEQAPLVKELRQLVPSGAFGYSAIDWGKSMAAVVGQLLNPDVVLMIQQKWATSGAVLPPPDFDKLPPADHIASFFNVSYQYIEASPEGLHQRVILKY